MENWDFCMFDELVGPKKGNMNTCDFRVVLEPCSTVVVRWEGL